MSFWRGKRALVAATILGGLAVIVLLAGCEEEAQKGESLVVLDHGPRSAIAGQGFNVQPEGRSAMWFKVEGGEEPITVVFAGENLRGYWDADTGIVTVALAGDKLAKEGTHEIRVCGPDRDTCSKPVYFEVLPSQPGTLRSEPLAVLDYGPRSAVAGRGFQVQPDGRSAMWFRVKGGREPMTVVFAGESLSGFWQAETGIVTVALDEDKLAKEGTREIRVCNSPGDVCSEPVYLRVLPPG